MKNAKKILSAMLSIALVTVCSGMVSAQNAMVSESLAILCVGGVEEIAGHTHDECESLRRIILSADDQSNGATAIRCYRHDRGYEANAPACQRLTSARSNEPPPAQPAPAPAPPPTVRAAAPQPAPVVQPPAPAPAPAPPVPVAAVQPPPAPVMRQVWAAPQPIAPLPAPAAVQPQNPEPLVQRGGREVHWDRPVTDQLTGWGQSALGGYGQGNYQLPAGMQGVPLSCEGIPLAETIMPGSVFPQELNETVGFFDAAPPGVRSVGPVLGPEQDYLGVAPRLITLELDPSIYAYRVSFPGSGAVMRILGAPNPYLQQPAPYRPLVQQRVVGSGVCQTPMIPPTRRNGIQRHFLTFRAGDALGNDFMIRVEAFQRQVGQPIASQPVYQCNYVVNVRSPGPEPALHVNESEFSSRDCQVNRPNAW